MKDSYQIKWHINLPSCICSLQFPAPTLVLARTCMNHTLTQHICHYRLVTHSKSDISYFIQDYQLFGNQALNFAHIMHKSTSIYHILRGDFFFIPQFFALMISKQSMLGYCVVKFDSAEYCCKSFHLYVYIWSLSMLDTI